MESSSWLAAWLAQCPTPDPHTVQTAGCQISRSRNWDGHSNRIVTTIWSLMDDQAIQKVLSLAEEICTSDIQANIEDLVFSADAFSWKVNGTLVPDQLWAALTSAERLTESTLCGIHGEYKSEDDDTLDVVLTDAASVDEGAIPDQMSLIEGDATPYIKTSIEQTDEDMNSSVSTFLADSEAQSDLNMHPQDHVVEPKALFVSEELPPVASIESSGPLSSSTIHEDVQDNVQNASPADPHDPLRLHKWNVDFWRRAITFNLPFPDNIHLSLG